MKVRSRIILSLLIAIIVFGVYVVFFGLSFGGKSFEPLRALNLGTDLEGGASIVFKLTPEEDENGEEIERDAAEVTASIEQIISVMQERLEVKRLWLSAITRQGEDGIRVDIPLNDTSPMQDATQIAEFLEQTADLTMEDVDGNVLMERSDIDSLEAIEGTLGEYIMYIITTEESKGKLEAETTEILEKGSSDRYLIINLDGEEIAKIYVTQVITNGICGFNSDYTEYEATNLADLVNSGKLSAEIKTAEESDTGAVLGASAKRLFLVASAAAVILFVLLLAVFYRWPGILGGVSVLFYVAASLFSVSLMRVQMMAWSIAALLFGLVFTSLSLMHIYEKCKEEFGKGKNLRAAFKSGYSAANKIISEIFVVCFLLFVILIMSNVAAIKSFSYCLGIGIVLSYLTTMVINRLFLRLLLDIESARTGVYFPANTGKGDKQ